MTNKISVFNLGISNLTSVLNVLDYIGVEYDLINNLDDLKKSQKLLLPGVGTFAAGIKALEQKNLIEEAQNLVINKKIPIFGICLGMQLLFEKSEESKGVAGLSFLAGEIIKIPLSPNYKNPRIGWAESEVKKDFLEIKKDQLADFYYIHDYHAVPKDLEIITITSEKNSITAAINKDNIFGCQFHPEKSHIQGINLIKAFSKI